MRLGPSTKRLLKKHALVNVLLVFLDQLCVEWLKPVASEEVPQTVLDCPLLVHVDSLTDKFVQGI